MTTPTTGYAPINGLRLYYEIHGSGQPLILLHGGFGLTSMFGEVLPLLAQNRQVIAVDLQGHGRTADIDRPMRLELMGDDIAGVPVALHFQADHLAALGQPRQDGLEHAHHPKAAVQQDQRLAAAVDLVV
jgi:pimeloyl-ACP methyl ester carboxylesterase